MTKIHPSASISPRAEIGADCEIGAECVVGAHAVIEPGAVLGPRNRIYPNAVVCSGTDLGADNEVHFGAILGHAPQHKHATGTPTRTRIGDRNVFREHCQVHRGSVEGGATVVGNGNLIMALAHVAHDCVLEDDVVVCNNTLLAGHIHVESRAVISGNCVVHQFSRIGRLAMVGGLSAVPRDVPPYMMAVGNRPCVVVGLNVVGLRRAGIDLAGRSRIRKAFRSLYRSGLILPEAVQQIAALGGPEVEHLVSFLRGSRRGILAGGRADDDVPEDAEAVEE